MKPRPTPVPANAIRVPDYAQLRHWADGFRDDKFNLLFVVGRPGLGKTRIVRGALAGRDHLLLEGHVTPLMMYAQLYRHRDRPVVIDDEDSVHSDPQKVRLMKCLCDSEPAKRLAWQSTSKLLEEMGLPTSFETASKVAVVTNHLSAVNPHTAALFDRGSVLSFEPSAREVHGQVATWFGDLEILAFFERWRRVIPTPSMRLYVKAKEMKGAGIDWRGVLMGQWRAGKLWLVEAVQRDPVPSTEEERAAAFEARGGGARATYFRHLRRWRLAVGKTPEPATA